MIGGNREKSLGRDLVNFTVFEKNKVIALTFPACLKNFRISVK